MSAHRDLEQQLLGARLITAEILYRMPDFPDILQSFTWQKLDQAPKLPRLTIFLNFWEYNIDGPIHSVRVAWRGLVSPFELTYQNHELRLH